MFDPAEVGGTSFGFTTYGIVSLGNPNIQPEEAKSYTLGLIFEPMQNLSATLDYWRVDRTNEIVQADPNALIPAGQCVNACDGTGGTPNLIGATVPGAQPNTFLYYDADGTLQTVAGFYRKRAHDIATGDEIGYGANEWKLVVDVEETATPEGAGIIRVLFIDADDTAGDHLFDPLDIVDVKAAPTLEPF